MMMFLQSARARLELCILVVLVLATTLGFWFSTVDIQAAAQFYHPETPLDVWPERHWWLWQLLFDYAFPFTITVGSLAFGLYVLSYFYKQARRFRRQALYLVLVIALGPGLVVNFIFKDHGGRARPVHISEFGGEFKYTPPLQFGHTNDKSFVCGHCSVGYSFFAVYFLAKHYKLFYFCLTLLFAWTMGYTRMIAGGHFLSDVLWSGYLVFLVAFLLYYGWYIRNNGAQESS